MNKRAFRAVMILHGDTQKAVAEALGVTQKTIADKINGVTDFKQSEIRKLIERYGLTPAQVDNIFFGADAPWKDL